MNGSQMPQRRIKSGEVTKVVTVRMAESDYERIQKKADEAGIKVSEYIRAVVLDAERFRDMVAEAEETAERIRHLFTSMSESKGD